MIAEENKHKGRDFFFLWWPAGLRYSTDPADESKKKYKSRSVRLAEQS